MVGDLYVRPASRGRYRGLIQLLRPRAIQDAAQLRDRTSVTGSAASLRPTGTRRSLALQPYLGHLLAGRLMVNDVSGCPVVLIGGTGTVKLAAWLPQESRKHAEPRASR